VIEIYKVEEAYGRYDIVKEDGTIIMDRFNSKQDAEYVAGALNIGLINWTGKHLAEFQQEEIFKKYHEQKKMEEKSHYYQLNIMM